MRIAIVGTGIAGLSAARNLCMHHNIEVFEADSRIGGHTNTVQVHDGKQILGVDTGFIVFNESNYPLLTNLFERIGVASRPTTMSFSVHCERSGLEYNGSSLGQFFCQKRNLFRPDHWGMFKDILRFHEIGPAALANGLSDAVTVEEFIAQAGLGRRFLDYYLVPLGASLWSCSGGHFRRFPMRFVIEFLVNHKMLQLGGRPQWRTVIGGSSAYIAPLVAPFAERIRLNHAVEKVRRHAGSVEVYTQHGFAGYFDEVVLATHADQSLKILADADREETALLTAFPYTENDVVLHTDTRVLPDEKKAWAAWNYRIPAASDERVSVSYDMNILQGLESDRTWCVSLNPRSQIEPDKVIARFNYAHPAYGPQRAEAQAQHAQFIRRRGISLCGAYWGYGFHEDGIASANRVCEAFDIPMAA